MMKTDRYFKALNWRKFRWIKSWPMQGISRYHFNFNSIITVTSFIQMKPKTQIEIAIFINSRNTSIKTCNVNLLVMVCLNFRSGKNWGMYIVYWVAYVYKPFLEDGTIVNNDWLCISWNMLKCFKRVVSILEFLSSLAVLRNSISKTWFKI